LLVLCVKQHPIRWEDLINAVEFADVPRSFALVFSRVIRRCGFSRSGTLLTSKLKGDVLRDAPLT